MLTTAHNGHWYDPAQTGQGLELRVLPNNDVTASLYLGRVPGWYSIPVALSVQGPQDPDANHIELPIYESRGAVFGESNPLQLVVVGFVRLTPRSDGSIHMTVAIRGDGNPQFSPAPLPIANDFNLVRLM